MKRKWSILLSVVLCFGLLAGCGGTTEEAAQEVNTDEISETNPEETANESVSGVNEELTEDINAWFAEWYGGEGAPDWYEDVTDIRIIDLENGKRSLVIESADPNESVASSMAMIIWGYDDTIEFVSVYDQNGNTLFTN